MYNRLINQLIAKQVSIDKAEDWPKKIYLSLAQAIYRSGTANSRSANTIKQFVVNNKVYIGASMVTRLNHDRSSAPPQRQIWNEATKKLPLICNTYLPFIKSHWRSGKLSSSVKDRLFGMSTKTEVRLLNINSFYDGS